MISHMSILWVQNRLGQRVSKTWYSIFWPWPSDIKALCFSEIPPKMLHVFISCLQPKVMFDWPIMPISLDERYKVRFNDICACLVVYSACLKATRSTDTTAFDKNPQYEPSHKFSIEEHQNTSFDHKLKLFNSWACRWYAFTRPWQLGEPWPSLATEKKDGFSGRWLQLPTYYSLLNPLQPLRHTQPRQTAEVQTNYTFPFL